MKHPAKKAKDLEHEVNELKDQLSAEKQRNSFSNALHEGGTLIVWAVDKNFDLFYYNQNYFNLFIRDSAADKKIGYEKDGRIHIVDAKPFWKKKYMHAFSGNAHNFDIYLERGGKEQWKAIFLNPIYDTRGNITGISGLAYDTTDKMQSKIALIKSEVKFRDIFESFQDLYFRCDFNGKLTMLSPSVKDIIGYSENELLEKNITNFYIYNIKSKYLLRQLAQEKRVRNFEASLIHKSGKIKTCICNVRVIQDNNGGLQYIEGVARDITEIKQANEALQHSKELAEKSLKIKERFLANMSHEIRTPLNGIMGMLHLLDETNLDAKQRQHVRTLKGSADILLNILNDLLDLSKIEAGKMPLNIAPLRTDSIFEKLLLLYEQQAMDSNITLQCKIDPLVPQYIESDETKLIQVYSNLISNALKFTPAGGSVAIGLNIYKQEKKKLILKGTVTDTGIGISSLDQTKLFNSFTQLDSSSSKAYKGTGLGLYITKRIIKLFRGKIAIDSIEGAGSTFWFTFETKAGKEYTKKTDKPFKLRHAPHILVVDDNMVNLELASEMLKQAGSKVTTVMSGQAAVHEANAHRYDAILMDVQMPDMDGIETAKKIRSKCQHSIPPIIAMTAYAIEGFENKAEEMGMDDYIPKPIDPSALIKKVYYWTTGNSEKRKKKKEKKDKLLTINQNTLNLLQKYAGKEAVESALKEFNSECELQLKSCSAYLSNGNFKEMSNVLHTLKGNAGTLGVEKMAFYAQKMEDDLKDKKYSNFEKNIAVLKSLYIDFKTQVDEVFIK